jgi:uncharacterized membrane protein
MTFSQHRAFVVIKHIVVIIAICLLAFLLNWRAYHSPGMQARFAGFDPSIANETLVPELLFGTEIHQSVLMPSNLKNVTGFSLLFSTWARTNTSEVTVMFANSETNEGQEFKLKAETLEDNSWVDFVLSQPLYGKGFIIIVKSDAAAGNGVTLWSSTTDSYNDGELMVNGTPTDGDICFKIIGKPGWSPLLTFRYLTLALTVLVLIGCYFALFVLKREFPRYAIIILAVGFMYVVVMTPYSQPDSATHVSNSEVMANSLLLKNEKLSLIGTQFATGVGHKQTSAGYISLVEDIFTVDHSTVRETPLTSYKGYPVMNYPLAYLPQAIGISVARIGWINNIWVYYAGTIANLIFYALISAMSIVIIPQRFKNAMIVLALLPMSLHQAASYSYDTFVNALSFFFLAYLLRLRYEYKQVGIKEIVILILTVTLLAPAKIFYGFLGLCVFILPSTKFKSKQQYWIAAALAVILPLFLTLIFKLPQAADIATSSSSQSWETYTISYAIEHPLRTIKIFIDTTFGLLPVWIDTFIGANLAGLSFAIPPHWTYAYRFVLLLTVFPNRNEGNEPDAKDRIVFFAVSFIIYASMLAAEFVGWTRYGNALVEGMQGRYFIPIALPLVCVCSNKLLHYYKKDFSNILIVCAIVLNIIITNYIARITLTTL